MNACLECGTNFASYSLFVRHMTRQHGVDTEALWRRIQQADGGLVAATRSERGLWYLYVQGRLAL